MQIVGENPLELPELNNPLLVCDVTNADEYPNATFTYSWSKMDDDSWNFDGQILDMQVQVII